MASLHTRFVRVSFLLIFFFTSTQPMLWNVFSVCTARALPNIIKFYRIIKYNRNLSMDSINGDDCTELICLPGQRLCLSDDGTIAGQGTYERQNYIYSRHAGVLRVTEKDKSRLIEVKCAGNLTLVPLPGDIVTARVLHVNQRFAKCNIICIADHILERTYRAIVRKEDVRATEKDRVEMYKSFRAGDIILARVLPQTELSCYQLSTAENELGVAVAFAAESGPYGEEMIPVGWSEMQCPTTLVKEPRKVAKIVPESALHVAVKEESNLDAK